MKYRLSTALLVTAALAALLCSGCSTHYRPRRSQRIAITMSRGQLTLYKNRKERSLGVFGGGLERAVADNAKAADYAGTHHSLLIGGFVLGVIGGASAGAGAGLVVYNTGTDGEPLVDVIGLNLAAGGLAMVLTSVFLEMSARTKMFDAINIYNDGVSARDADKGPSGPPKGTVDLSE